MATNPEKQEKLRNEILTILPSKDSQFTEASLKNIPYMRACLKESLRYMPVVVGNTRTLANDVVLSGYQVPKGTKVILVSSTINRNKKYYPRAEEFLPERWLRAPEKSAGQCPQESLKVSNPFVFTPFGFGPRMCIGKRIVDMELELGIARILRHFRVEFNYPTDNAFKSLIINVPNIPLRFKFIDLEK